MVSPGGVLQRAQATLPWRAWERYGTARGGVLAGGVAYAGFFSLFPVLAFGFTVFGLVLGNNAGLQDRVVQAVNNSFGTAIIKTTPTAEGFIELSKLTAGSTLTLWGIIGIVGLLLTGLGWLDAIREGIRAMFGQSPAEGNAVVTKLRDVGVLATLGLVVLFSAIAGFVVNSAAGWLLETAGLGGSLPGKILLGGISALLLLGVDVVVFVILFRLLAGVDVPRHDLWDAALFGGIGLGLLKIFAGILLNGASHNKFLLSAGLLLGLLVWLNLVARLTLVAAAWGAIVALDRGHLVDDGHGRVSVPAVPAGPSAPARTTAAAGARTTAPAGAAAGARPVPAVTTRAGDRVSVAAGAILGASALIAVRTTTTAVRSLVRAARDHDDD